MMWGALFAVLSAATFGFNNAAIRRGVLSGSVLQALAVTVPMGVPFILLVLLASGQLGRLADMSLAAYGWFALAGVVHFVWGRYCNYRATKAIGGNLTGPWAQLNVVLSLVLAIIFLGEVLTPMSLLGIAFIMLGVAATTQAGRADRRQAARAATRDPEPAPTPTPAKGSDAADKTIPPFKPNYVEGYTFAILTATGHGVSPIFVALALDGLGPGHSIAGALVSYFAAALLVLIIITVGRRWQHIRSMDGRSARWFTLGGVMVGTSQVLRYVALSLAPVSVVMPIQSTSALFRIIFAWFINREHEIFGLWIMLGVLLTIVGVTTLAMSVDLLAMLSRYAVMPEWLAVEWFGD